jgi:hypothetical protein
VRRSVFRKIYRSKIRTMYSCDKYMYECVVILEKDQCHWITISLTSQALSVSSLSPQKLPG